MVFRLSTRSLRVNGQFLEIYTQSDISENFCDYFMGRKSIPVDIAADWRLLERQAAAFIRNRYDLQYRQYLREDVYYRLANQMPYLTLVRGPSTYYADILSAFELMMDNSRGILDKLTAEDEVFGLSEKVMQFEQGILSKDVLDDLKNYLWKSLEFDQVANSLFDSFKGDAEAQTLEGLLNEMKRQQRVRNVARGVGILGLVGLCLMPTGRSAHMLFKAFNFIRTTNFKMLCAGSILSPISLYIVYDSWERYNRTLKLFYNRDENPVLFARFQDLADDQREFVLNLFLAPLDATAIAQSLKGARILHQEFKSQILRYAVEK